MSRADDAPRSDLDALLASPTPTPDDTVGSDPSGVASDASGETSERDEVEGETRAERSGGPVRGRLEAWLRGGSSDGSGAAAPDPGPSVRPDRGPASDHGQESDTDARSDLGAGVDPDSVDAVTSGGPSDPRSGVDVGPGVDGGVDGGAERSDDALAGGLGELRSLPVEAIEPNRYQPRRQFDEEALEALTESVRELGVLQPVLVRPLDGERFELVAGERRWRATQRAGLRMIPALVRESGDLGALEQAIVENLHRQDLSPLEEAAAYQELIADFGLTQERVARRVGKSRSAVTNTLRLLQLPVAVQRLVGDGLLSAGHARALLSLTEPDQQRALAERVIDEELSVRQTEEAARTVADGDDGAGRTGRGGSPRRGSTGASAASLEVRALLEDRLETQVEVQSGSRGGRLVIRYADDEDLDRLVRLVLEEPSSD